MRAFIVALIFMITAPFVALAQEDDRGTLTAFLEDNLSSSGRQVTVTGFRGALSSRAEIDSIQIADAEGTWLTLNGVVIDWNRSALFRGVVDVTELLAEEIIVARQPLAAEGAAPAPEASGFSLPDLPVSIRIEKLEATRIVLEEPILGQRIEGSLQASANLDGGEGNLKLDILRTDDGPDGNLSLAAEYENDTNVLMIVLDVQEEPGGIAASLLDVPGSPSIELLISGSGPLDDFVADIALRTDGDERLAGQVTLQGQVDGAQKFRVDLGGDVAPLFLPDYAEFFGPEIRLKAEGTRSESGQLDLSALELDARALVLDGSAVIASDGLPQRFTLTGRLGLPDGTPVLLPLSGEGDTRVSSADLRVGFDATKGDGWSAAVTLNGLVREDVLLSRATIKGSGRINRRAGNGGPIVGGTFTFGTTGLVFTDTRIATALGQDMEGKLVFDWQQGGRGLRVGRLELTEAGYEIVASGTVGDLETGFRMRGSIDARYDDLFRLSGLANRPLAGSATFRLNGQGSPLGGEFDLSGRVGGTDIKVDVAELDNLLRGSSLIEFAVGRNKEGTFLRKLVIDAEQLIATAKGKLSSTESDLTGRVDFSDLSALGPQYGGSLSADATFSGTLENGRATLDGTSRGLKIGQQQADALIGGQSNLSLAVGLMGDRYEIEKAVIENAQIAAEVTGFYDPAGSDLTASVSLPDLSPLGPGYQGGLQANVTAKGKLGDGRITLDGTSRAVKIGQQQVDALLAGESKLSVAVALTGDRYEIEKAVIDNPQIAADVVGFYDPAGSDLTANVSLPDISPLGSGYRGGLQATVSAKGTLGDGRVTLDGTGQNLAVGQAAADKLLAGTSTVTAAVSVKDKTYQVEVAKISNPQVTVDASGVITETATNINLEAELANLALLVPDFAGPVRVSGTAVDDGNGIALNLAGTGPGSIDARVSGRLARDMSSADLAVSGSAQAALANPFLGNRSISGLTRFDMRLNGPLALSSLSGQATLSEGRLATPSLPFSLRGIGATANFNGNTVRLNLNASPSTGGDLRVEGTVGLDAPNTANLRIALRDITLKDPDLYEVSLGGDVTVDGPLTGGATIGGLIRIREAELRVPTSGSTAIGSLPGLKHVNEPAPVRTTRAKAGLLGDGGSTAGGGGQAGRPFTLNLVVEAPSRVFVRGRGIDAELGGRATLRGDTNNIIPSGALELIRGRIDILGKRLDLDEARLLLQGDLIPYISIIARNESDGVTTSVIVEGRADEPEITFSSVPDLPEEEVLARLLFGQGLEKISALQALQLASAVATLAGKGGDGIVGKLRKNFNLDDLDVSTDAEGNVSLRAGKYISKNAYTEVEVGQDGKSKINLNLDLRKGVTLRGSVGTSGEAGIGIFVEKDY